MENTSTSLESLSKVAGVDFTSLREKYSKVQQTQSSQSNQTKQQKPTDPQATTMGNLERLDNYRICKSCSGRGTVKVLYNHMVLERDCEKCEGESIVLSQQRLQEIAEGIP